LRSLRNDRKRALEELDLLHTGHIRRALKIVTVKTH